MTRSLSHLLHTDNTELTLQLRQLERTNGHRNTDISLSVEVLHCAQAKVRALGLDAHDTTAQELYQALMARVAADDRRLERSLQTIAATHVNAEARLVDGLTHALQSELRDLKVLAVKPTALKRLLKKTPAKRVLKQLRYRSYDAMLRQEPAALLATIALQIESQAWHKAWLDSYKQLSAQDFEDRAMQIMQPTGAKWQTLAGQLTRDRAHTVLATAELGSIVLLPLPHDRPAGMVIATAALALHEVNRIQAFSTYVRAISTQAGFGEQIKSLVQHDIYVSAPQMPQALPWRVLQRYFATTTVHVNDEIFGPYMHSKDFAWIDVEACLSRLCPALAFWEHASFVSFVHDGQAVSLNLLDAAINCCNQVTYAVRRGYHAQQMLWSELYLRYIDHASIEAAVQQHLQPQLALEPALMN